MKHASPASLRLLSPLLASLRALPRLVERTPGSFYLGSSSFLHFHGDPAGLFADVKLDSSSFERFPVTTAAERASLLKWVQSRLDRQGPATDDHAGNPSATARFIEVKVKPNASSSTLRQDPEGRWHAELKAAPVDGKANAELIALVSRHFGCAKSAVAIKAGKSRRAKLVKIEGG